MPHIVFQNLSGWEFVNNEPPTKQWQSAADGATVVIHPPGHGAADHLGFTLAFYPETAFSHERFAISCYVQKSTTAAGALGLVFGAKSSDDYHLLHIPWGAEQEDSHAFWAGIAKADPKTGFLRQMCFEIVPGVSSVLPRNGDSIAIRIEIRCDRGTITTSIDGRPGPSTVVGPEADGYIGLFNYCGGQFMDLTVDGDEANLPNPWSLVPFAPQRWTQPDVFKVNPDVVHLITTGMVAAVDPVPGADSILLAIYDGTQVGDSHNRTHVFRSDDDGLGWRLIGRSPPGFSRLAARPSAIGEYFSMTKEPDPPAGPDDPVLFQMITSSDGGTWRDPVTCTVPDLARGSAGRVDDPQIRVGWNFAPCLNPMTLPEVIGPDGNAVNPLLAFVQVNHSSSDVLSVDRSQRVTTYTDKLGRVYGHTHSVGYSAVSYDNGRTWTVSSPLNGDAEFHSDQTEPCGVVTENEAPGQDPRTLRVYIRPIYSPWLWETESVPIQQSLDYGRKWRRLRPTGFAAWAQNVARTADGTLVIVHRYPHLSVHLSSDQGLTWDAGTVIAPSPEGNPHIYCFRAVGRESEFMVAYPCATEVNGDKYRIRLQHLRVVGLGRDRRLDSLSPPQP